MSYCFVFLIEMCVHGILPAVFTLVMDPFASLIPLFDDFNIFNQNPLVSKTNLNIFLETYHMCFFFSSVNEKHANVFSLFFYQPYEENIFLVDCPGIDPVCLFFKKGIHLNL